MRMVIMIIQLLLWKHLADRITIVGRCTAHIHRSAYPWFLQRGLILHHLMLLLHVLLSSVLEFMLVLLLLSLFLMVLLFHASLQQLHWWMFINVVGTTTRRRGHRFLVVVVVGVFVFFLFIFSILVLVLFVYWLSFCVWYWCFCFSSANGARRATMAFVAKAGLHRDEFPSVGRRKGTGVRHDGCRKGLAMVAGHNFNRRQHCSLNR